jgi:hypothetical protein
LSKKQRRKGAEEQRGINIQYGVCSKQKEAEK